MNMEQRSLIMIDTYLLLSSKEQSQILRAISSKNELSKVPLLLEKDIWVCWALEMLFKMPNPYPMAFKGGTSLSKVFNAIERFSEDVDITIDYRAFDCDDPFVDGISKKKTNQISDDLRLKVSQYLKDCIHPYFKKRISEQFERNIPNIELDDDGETIHINYPSVIEQKSGYVRDSVRLEFGGRNLTTPNKIHTITTDISQYVNNVKFPQAEVSVLSPDKTFWEKVTLIHYECNRPQVKLDANRISRHWYDVAMLANHEIGKQAINNRELLNEVIKIKKTFYNASYAKYDDCVLGKLRLIPNEMSLIQLEKDFHEMLNNKMFYAVQPNFSQIIDQIEKLERKINESIYK